MSKLQEIVNSVKKPELSLVVDNTNTDLKSVPPSGMISFVTQDPPTEDIPQEDMKNEMKQLKDGMVLLRSMFRRGELDKDAFDNIMVRAELSMRRRFGKFL